MSDWWTNMIDPIWRIFSIWIVPVDMVSILPRTTSTHQSSVSWPKSTTSFSSSRSTPSNKIRFILLGQVEQRLSIFLPILRYIGDVGDVVVGRITAVESSRWKVNINSTLDGMLPLTSVNLPGGELRRRSEEDERMMRHYFVENDLISVSFLKKK